MSTREPGGWGRRLDSSFDLCASVLGAISADSAAAKDAARLAAAFYLSWMAPELVERHGIAFEDVRPVVEAFGRGDLERALALTTSEMGERLSIAGAPSDWIERIRADVLPHGYNHVALGLVDPSLVETWSGCGSKAFLVSPSNSRCSQQKWCPP
jgi:5,10-methylenetetrahydromethanopterin reductase